MKLQLKKRGGGIVLEIDMPQSLTDVPLAKYISFLNEAEKIGADGENPILQMALAIGEFTGVPIAEILESEVGNIYDSKISNVDGTLRTMFGWILNVCKQYEPKPINQFTHKGQTFIIPELSMNALGGYILPHFSVSEAVECYETQRLTQKMIDENGDENGSLAYSFYLRRLAIIARKKNNEWNGLISPAHEMLPSSDADREQFINERMRFFDDIPASIALDNDFFLSLTLPQSVPMSNVSGFLIRRSLGIAAGILRLNGRHTPVD